MTTPTKDGSPKGTGISSPRLTATLTTALVADLGTLILTARAGEGGHSSPARARTGVATERSPSKEAGPLVAVNNEVCVMPLALPPVEGEEIPLIWPGIFCKVTWISLNPLDYG